MDKPTDPRPQDGAPATALHLLDPGRFPNRDAVREFVRSEEFGLLGQAVNACMNPEGVGLLPNTLEAGQDGAYFLACDLFALAREAARADHEPFGISENVGFAWKRGENIASLAALVAAADANDAITMAATQVARGLCAWEPRGATEPEDAAVEAEQLGDGGEWEPSPFSLGIIPPPVPFTHTVALHWLRNEAALLIFACNEGLRCAKTYESRNAFWNVLSDVQAIVQAAADVAAGEDPERAVRLDTHRAEWPDSTKRLARAVSSGLSDLETHETPYGISVLAEILEQRIAVDQLDEPERTKAAEALAYPMDGAPEAGAEGVE